MPTFRRNGEKAMRDEHGILSNVVQFPKPKRKPDRSYLAALALLGFVLLALVGCVCLLVGRGRKSQVITVCDTLAPNGDTLMFAHSGSFTVSDNLGDGWHCDQIQF
jgi:hypothetical protein